VLRENRRKSKEMISLIEKYFKWVRENMSLPTKLIIQMLLTSGGMAFALSLGFLLNIRDNEIDNIERTANLIMENINTVLFEENVDASVKEKIFGGFMRDEIKGILIRGEREFKIGDYEFPDIEMKENLRQETRGEIIWGRKVGGDGRSFYILIAISRDKIKKNFREGLLRAAIIFLSVSALILLVGVLFNHFEIVSPLRRNVFLLSDSIKETKNIFMDVKTGTAEQAASVTELSAASQEIANSANQIAEMSHQVEAASKVGFTLSEQSDEEVSRIVDGISMTKERMTNLSSRIMELNELSKRIGSITEVIEDISEQTNLLSVNATIEAIGAGEGGRRFRVVANEIRALSGRTRSATEEIRRIVAEINSSITKTVMATDEGIKAFDELTKAIGALKYIFDELKRAADSTLKIAQDIKSSTDQQVSSTSQMTKALEDVSEVANHIAENAAKASAISEGLEPLLEILKRMI
jgi:uncharacterized protein with PhoU and TrkA domain